MAITVKNLEPLNIGIPVHAPKLWKMSAPDRADNRLGSLAARLRSLSQTVDLIDRLEPLSTTTTNH